MNFVNRIGHDNFVWWLGVVEDDKDPLHLGRCRVRIFGSHSPNLELIPTDTLPWAMPVNPTNNSKTVEAPKLGEYILGFFLDGLSSQFPVMLGVIPAITQEEPKAGTGFSALAGEYNRPEVAQTNQEKTPQPPDNAPGMNLQQAGKPTTPANAWTVANTVVGYTNSDLVHSCDFRFLINLGDLNIGTIENPVTLIKNSIANAKNKAAAIIRVLLSNLLDTYRITFDGILVALNADPTGIIGQAVSEARNVIRKINALSRKLAEYAGSAALMISFVAELKQIVEWIKTLPSKVLGMLTDCLKTFTNGITAAAKQVSAIPGQVSNGLLGAFQDLQTNAESAKQAAQDAQASANVPNTIIEIVTSPTTANVDNLTVYISNAYPNTNVIISQTNSASFNVSNTSTP